MDIPTDIIIYAVIAAFLVLWLGRILGTRSGAERQRPNPFALPPQGQQPAAGVSAPEGAAAQAAPAARTASPTVDAGLVQIALADRDFEPARFVANAKEAFSMVVGAFAQGDLQTLGDLLAPDVFRGFKAEIERRKAEGRKVETEVLSVNSAEIVAARLEGNSAFVTLRIKADETYVLSDADGKVLAGSPERVVTMTDVWTFTRDVKSSDPRWFVSATRDDVKEESGMTLPDAGA